MLQECMAKKNILVLFTEIKATLNLCEHVIHKSKFTIVKQPSNIFMKCNTQMQST